MIFGTGIDLVDVERIERILDRYKERALKKIFTDYELEYSRKQKYPETHLAARFAAKEAFVKALGTGIGPSSRLNEVGVIHNPEGRPLLEITGSALQTLVERCGPKNRVHVSLSHTRTQATAIVEIEIDPIANVS
jgi:holo-[acyl-carrier protein] synthase